MKELISVITTVKNGEEYIGATLLTVYSQTYKYYEHIIVNDGSTDGTLDKICVFMKERGDHKVKIINTSGLGRGPALNLGVKAASGGWIAIIDADDIWHKHKLEVQAGFLSNNISVIATDHLSFIDEKKLTLDYKTPFEIKDLFIRDFLVRNSICHSSAVIKKEDCIYDEKRKSQFDLELWLRLVFSGKKLKKIQAVLTYHRIHQNQHFESKLGKKMTYNSFKLKSKYAIKSNKYFFLLYSCFLFVCSLILPKKLLNKKIV